MVRGNVDVNYVIRERAMVILLCLYFFSSLIPAFKSLPLTPHETFYVYVWFACTVLFFPRILLARESLYCVLFLVLHLLFILTNRYVGFEEKYKTLVQMFFMYAFPVTVFVFLFRAFSFNSIRLLARLVLTFLVITSITTLLVLHNYPEASRALAGNDNSEEVLALMGMNVGTYDFIYQLVLICPLLFYFYKTRGELLWLVLLLLFGAVIVYAQFAAAFFLLVVNMFFGLLIIYGVSIKRYFVLGITFGLSLFFMGGVVANSLIAFSGLFTNFDGVHQKLLEVIMSLNGESLEGTNLDAYNKQFNLSLQAFLKSPILGGHSGGAHHYWMDILAAYGVVGFVICVYIFKGFVLSVGRYPFLSRTERHLLWHLTIMFVTIGLNKNIVFGMPVSLFVVCPLLLACYGCFGFRKHRILYQIS